MEGGRWHFGLASHAHERMTDTSERRGGTSRGGGGSGDKGGRRPWVGWLGPRAKMSWAGAKIFQGKWCRLQIELSWWSLGALWLRACLLRSSSSRRTMV
jgi:hypothetical protein